MSYIVVFDFASNINKKNIKDGQRRVKGVVEQGNKVNRLIAI